MDIKLEKIKIKDLVKGFEDNREGGVVGYNGLLDIRPAYQREFIYSAKNQKAVIETVRKSFPLNVMYWADNGGTYEILDGQQRTLSICGFTEGFVLKGMRWLLFIRKEIKKVYKINYTLFPV